MFENLTVEERLIVQSLFLGWTKYNEGCLDWTGMTTLSDKRYSSPYGLVFRKVEGEGKVRIRAHRISYMLFVGPIPDDLMVCHHCDRPICVRSEHLFLGTMKDNIQDALKKGRVVVPEPKQGERNNQAKLTADKVIEMRRLYDTTPLTVPAIAAKFNISRSQAHRIVTRRVWTHV